MPRTEVRVFKEEDGTAPLLEWLDEQPDRARAKCDELIGRLIESGHELRRPSADILRDGIYEIRARAGRVRLRMLYFFVGRNVAVLSHGFGKDTPEVPESEIERALDRKRRYEADPDRYTYEGE